MGNLELNFVSVDCDVPLKLQEEKQEIGDLGF